MNDVRAGIRGLAERVATFHLTDRTMVRAQRAFEAALAAGEPSNDAVTRYVTAVRSYFTGFDRDAKAQLASVDRELERLYQRQYNLAAERGVAVRRIEIVRDVLDALAEQTPA